MKKGFLFSFVLLLLILNAAAQMGTEAKLKFQQAQEAYENGQYFAAADIAFKTYELNKAWTPALRHLYIKSAYLSYKNPPPGGAGYYATFSNFTLFIEHCNDFFSSTNKNTFPPDKYQDIVEAHQYFQQMQKKYEYQKDRTPEKAVAFLNDCLKKFGQNLSVESKNLTRYYYEPPKLLTGRTAFQLDSPYLKLVLTATAQRRYGKGKKAYSRSEIYYQVDLLDFSRATNFSEYRTSNIEGQTTYQNGNKIMMHFYRKSNVVETRVYDELSRQPDEVTAENEKEEQKIKRDTTGFPPKLVAGVPTTAGFDIFYYFKQDSQEFKDGNYADRIKEAFQFLIDYYPKRKQEVVNERKNGF
ncbi:MAG: hypothetical protein ACTHMV_01055 [Chitinophagaceae bacterium]